MQNPQVGHFMRRISALWLLCLAATPCLAATGWQGRSLSDVLDELRAGGLPVMYSSQLVHDDYVISSEPAGSLQLDRLRSALARFGLTLRTLEEDQGYAVVRATQPSIDGRSASSDQPVTAAPLEEVTVIASRYQLGGDTVAGPHTLPQQTLEHLAGAQQDALRSVQYLPGVASNLSALSHVRGGYEDENLIRFDGMELFKPVHLKSQQGLFGLLDPSWTQAMTFYSGAYPVSYGNHNASVLDITPHQSDPPHHELSTSMLYAQVFSAGSYDQQAGHWLMGYRRSTVAEVLRHSEKQVGEPEFEDLLLHHRYQFAAGELSTGLLRLNDDITLRTDNGEQQADSNDHDTYLWAHWHYPGTQDDAPLESHTHLSRASLSNQRTAQLTRASLNTGTLQDARSATVYSLQQQLSWRGQHSRWQGGVALQYTEAQARYQSNATYLAPLRDTFALPGTRVVDNRWQAHDLYSAIYLDTQQTLGAWQLQSGLRADQYGAVSDAWHVSPRLTLQYTTPVASSAYLSVGRYVQHEQLAQRDSDSTSTAPVESLQQTVLGYHTRMAGLQWRIEVYDKRGQSLRSRAQNWLGLLSLSSELELDRYQFSSNRSRAQGIEVTLSSTVSDRSDQSPWNWWLSYSYSRAQDLYRGTYQPRTWDQPHAVSGGLLWQQARWQLSSTLSAHTGWTYTPLHIQDTGNSQQITLGARNAARFDHFASLQLRAEYSMPARGMQLTWSAELRNALNRHNDCCSALLADQHGIIRQSTSQGFAMIPVLGISARF